MVKNSFAMEVTFKALTNVMFDEFSEKLASLENETTKVWWDYKKDLFMNKIEWDTEKSRTKTSRNKD